MADPALIPHLPDVSPPTSLIAAMTLAVIALAAVVVYLFRYYTAKTAELIAAFNQRVSELTTKQAEAHKAWVDEREGWCNERAAWAAERTKIEQHRTDLRLEYEMRHRELSNKYADQMRELYETTLTELTAARREYTMAMDAVADKAAESTAKLGVVIEKIYDFAAGYRRGNH